MSHLRLVKNEHISEAELPPVDPVKYRIGKTLAIAYMLFLLTWLIGLFAVVLKVIASQA
jgi:hypothetical protein